MISLRRYLDPRANDTAEAWKSAYRALLAGLADCAVQVCEPVSEPTQSSLNRLQEALSGSVSPGTIAESAQRAEGELRDWRDRAARFYRQKAGEVKELMVMIARTAELVAERDRRYGPKFHDLATRLQTVASMDDLTGLRTSLLESVVELNQTVEQMRQESQDAVAALQSEVINYRAQLEVVEQAACADALTGIANRRRAENEIARRIAGSRSFCLLLADLNGLKRVNDQHGHNAGDELLTHFANELRHLVRSTDLVARWGGDEFVIVAEGSRSGAEALMARIRQWVFGGYTLKSVSSTVKVEVSAALGLAQWEPGMDQAQLLEAADREMYRDKATHRIARLE